MSEFVVDMSGTTTVDAGTADLGEPIRAVSPAPFGPTGSVAVVADEQSEHARAAILNAIIETAPRLTNSPAGIRDLAEAYALLERDLVPRASVAHATT